MITANHTTAPAPTESNTKKLRPAAAKLAAKRKTASSKRASAPSTGRPAQKSQAASRPSKQDRVVALLRRTEGVTVAAVMKATGWQKHSVHGFFAGVVRKKLGLNLVSAETEGKGVYRIVSGKSGKTGTKSGKRVGATSSPVRKRAAA